MGTLYVIATPIGNLEDISLRALRLLGEVGLIAAEDTRTARVVLTHHGLRNRLVSYNEHNKTQRIPELLEALAESDVALVSDAGTPAISDPGVELVAAARGAGYEVVAVPGPSAPATALSIAGLRARTYVFLGFLPRTDGPLKRLLASYETREETVVAFESPHRLTKTLAAMEAVLPARRIAVCRELTKLHEEVFVGSAAEAREHFTAPRGEIVIVIEGADGDAPVPEAASAEDALRDEVARLRAAGLTRAQASQLLGDRLPRRRLYELWLASEKGE